MNRLFSNGLFVTTLGLATTLGCGGDGDDGADTGSGGKSSGGSESGGSTNSGGSGLSVTGGKGNGGGGPGGLGGSDSECGGSEIEAAPVLANVLFVIDQSGSMDDTPGGFTESKWDTLVASMNQAIEAVQDDVMMGLKLYPTSGGGDECTVEDDVEVGITVGQDAVAEMQAVLGDTSPDGQTPTAAALDVALDYFTRGEGKGLEGSGFVVLATDGGPNCGSDDSCTIDSCGCKGAECDPSGNFCSEEAARCTINLEGTNCGNVCDGGTVCTEANECLDDAATLEAVHALAAAGIQTIVVGMPGSEAYQGVLDSLAVAGGRPAQAESPRYHQVTEAAGLSQTLKDITRGVIRTCEIEAAEPPTNLSRVNVYLDGEVIPKNDENGWRYKETTSSLPLIELTGSVCDLVLEQGASSISVEYGCQTIVK